MKNGIYRLQEGMALISHISEKGHPVGYIKYRALWYGPVAWSKFGSSQLKNSRFDVIDGFGAGSRTNLKEDVTQVKSNAHSVNELLKLLKSEQNDLK